MGITVQLEVFQCLEQGWGTHFTTTGQMNSIITGGTQNSLILC